MDGPIADGELDGLFSLLSNDDRIIIAVSGGGDSTALMVLAAHWREIRSDCPEMCAVTVDHGLRAGSREEAISVGEQARRLGVPHEILTWTGEKPESDIQAAAREARYDLLIERAHEIGATAIVLAHHMEDQAETFLLRLARGSGVAGLSAMAAERVVDGVRLVRPLLGVSRRRLIATLENAGISWIEDPSNEATKFARVRMRALMPALADEGLTAERLAATAERMRDAAGLIDQQVGDLLTRFALFHPGGFVGLHGSIFSETGNDALRHVLRRLLLDVGGETFPPRLERLDGLLAAIKDDNQSVKRTLAGVVIEAAGDRIWFYREIGRDGIGDVELSPGDTTLWDRRFRVSLSQTASAGISIRALGALGRGLLPVPNRGAWPIAATETVPSGWAGEDLVAVPSFGYCDTERFSPAFTAVWQGGNQK